MVKAPPEVSPPPPEVSPSEVWRQKQNKVPPPPPSTSVAPASEVWRQNKVPKAPPRSKKSASPINKRGLLGRLPSDTEEGASNLIASCEQYLDENPVIINPFVDVKMDQSADIGGSNSSLAQAHRKLSSVSDIRDSIKVTHEDANLSFSGGCQTVPRAFSPRAGSSMTAEKSRQMVPKPPAENSRQMASSSGYVVARSRPSQALYKRQDGTESVRSFVIVSNNSTLDLNSDEDDDDVNDDDDPSDNSEDEWSDDDDSYNQNKSASDFSASTNSKNPRNKGFVNKCVTRVKSLVNPTKN